jgi:hypothetical protein
MLGFNILGVLLGLGILCDAILNPFANPLSFTNSDNDTNYHST